MIEPGKELEINGALHRWEITSYTLVEFFCHPGPGWDSRTHLLDEQYAMGVAGRTFTWDEIATSQALQKSLPADTPHGRWVRV